MIKQFSLAAVLFAAALAFFPAKVQAQEAVDLGLSVKWATCNLGATKPEQAGTYYAWGEIKPKAEYSWSNYKWCKGTENTLTKYNYLEEFGSVDSVIKLEKQDDPAYVQTGGKWRMPTEVEFRELIRNCSWNTAAVNGVLCFKGVSRINGKVIYFPCAGVKEGSKLVCWNDAGFYWTSTINVYNEYEGATPHQAWHMYLCDEVAMLPFNRCLGISIRPVTDK